MLGRGMALGAIALGAAVGWPASEEARAQPDQIAAGQMVFQEICSRCHGESGQGEEAPAIIGADSQLASFRTTPRLFDYILESMPDDEPGALTGEQAYAVLAFLLSQNALNGEGMMLGPDTIEAIPLN
jgi:cytochrome c